MFSPAKLATFLTVLLVASFETVRAERHVVHFDNRCGTGSPRLIQGPNTLSTGGDYVSNGPLIGAIAYLQTGACLFNGEHCTTVETTLRNPPSPGAGSSTDITLISPHSFSVTTGFGYYNGCDNAGADCNNANCPTAFHQSTDTFVQVACQNNDVNLVITFCL